MNLKYLILGFQTCHLRLNLLINPKLTYQKLVPGNPGLIDLTLSVQELKKFSNIY